VSEGLIEERADAFAWSPSDLAQEAGDLGREAVGLVDVDPVTGRLDADPADAVLIEERAAALADAAGDVGGEQHRGRSSGPSHHYYNE